MPKTKKLTEFNFAAKLREEARSNSKYYKATQRIGAMMAKLAKEWKKPIRSWSVDDIINAAKFWTQNDDKGPRKTPVKVNRVEQTVNQIKLILHERKANVVDSMQAMYDLKTLVNHWIAASTGMRNSNIVEHQPPEQVKKAPIISANECKAILRELLISAPTHPVEERKHWLSAMVLACCWATGSRPSDIGHLLAGDYKKVEFNGRVLVVFPLRKNKNNKRGLDRRDKEFEQNRANPILCPIYWLDKYLAKYRLNPNDPLTLFGETVISTAKIVRVWRQAAKRQYVPIWDEISGYTPRNSVDSFDLTFTHF